MNPAPITTAEDGRAETAPKRCSASSTVRRTLTRSKPGIGGRTGTAPGLQHERVEREVVLAAVGGRPDGHRVPRRVDVDDLGVDADVEAEALEELLGCLEEQVVLVLDDAADVVRQAAVGVGDVTRPLDHHDLGLLVEATQAGGRRHAAGDTPHHHDPHRGVGGARLGGAARRGVGVRAHRSPPPRSVGPPTVPLGVPRTSVRLGPAGPLPSQPRDRPAHWLRPPPDPSRRDAPCRRRAGASPACCTPCARHVRPGRRPDRGARLPRRCR